MPDPNGLLGWCLLPAIPGSAAMARAYVRISLRQQTGDLPDADADDLFIHLAEMLLPDGDADDDGIAHAEVAREESDAPLACLCGTPANTLTELDAHLRAVFMPADGIGPDGTRHAPFPEDFSGREDFCRQ